MERRTILAIGLSFLIYIAWQKYYIEPRMPQQAQTTALQTEAPSAPSVKQSVGTGELAPAPKQKARPSQHASLETSIGTAVIGDDGNFFSDWTLKRYRLGIEKTAPPVDLNSVTNEAGAIQFAVDDMSLAYLSSVQATRFEATQQGVNWIYEDANVKLTRSFSNSPNAAYVDAKITAEFKTKPPKYAYLSVTSQLGNEADKDHVLMYFTNESIERVGLKGTSLKEVATPVDYIGSSSRYFVLALLPEGTGQPRALIQPASPSGGRVSLVYPVSGNSITIPARVYFGPKELPILRSVNPKLDHTVDLGWFTIVAYPLLNILRWLYQYVHNYGIAIIILTLFLKIITYPLTYKSMKSMKEMAKIQPQLQKLRERYKDDREALNREMMTLMRGHGYNPAAGCLPMLIQMPIFIALYRVLYSSIELYHAPFAFWIHDLSVKDPFYITPVLMSVTMFVQQKLSPQTASDPAQQKMMQMMPLIFGAFMLALPSGLTLYMLVNAIAGIVQQMMLNKKLNISHATGAR